MFRRLVPPVAAWKLFHPRIVGIRHYKLWDEAFRKYLYKNRLLAGPEKERPRSYWLNWNYDKELYCFGKRLGEDFNKTTLLTAFTDISYTQAARTEMTSEEAEAAVQESPEVKDNTALTDTGLKVTLNYVKAFLRHHYPALPEEGISAIGNKFTSESILNHVGRNLGVADLVRTAEFPVPDRIIAQVFAAVIGALYHDQGLERAQRFIHDFILTQLVGKEIANWWDISDPMGMLAGVLAGKGMSAPEPRLLRETGKSTILACYMVGIYADRELIGQSFGETVNIAEELAARAALRNLFGLGPTRLPLFDGRPESFITDLDLKTTNPTLEELGYSPRLSSPGSVNILQ